MHSIPHLREAVECLLDECLTDIPRASRQRLAFFVVGVLLAGTVVLRRIATTHAYHTPHTAIAASHERRLRRTLNDAHLAQAVVLYGRVVRRVLRRLPADKRLHVLVDESGHSTVVRCLVAALYYRGRAVPLAWVVWPAYQPHPHSYWADCADLLTAVAELLPAHALVSVLADRAFGCPGFIDLITARGWQYIVRVQGQTRLRHADGTLQALNTLLKQAGTWWCGAGWVFKKEGWRAASVVAYWRVGCDAPLLLVSNLPPSLTIVRQYRLRAAIEALFRDWKTSGFGWEQSQVRDVKHQEVLVEVLALATLLTLCLGEEAAHEIVAQPKQTGKRRPWSARDSLFRLGRDRLWQRVWRNDTSPLVWELTQSGDEQWSQDCWRAARPQVEVLYETERVGRRERRRLVA